MRAPRRAAVLAESSRRSVYQKGRDMTSDDAPLDLDQALAMAPEAYRDNRITRYLSRPSDGSIGSTLSVELPGEDASEVQEGFPNVLGHIGMIHTSVAQRDASQLGIGTAA
jgi:hypothetical protein